MKTPLDNSDRRSILLIIAVYALFAALWIYFSDEAVGLMARDRQMIIQISQYKGFLFIIVTSALLYLLIARNLAKTRLVEKELKRSQSLTNALLSGTSDSIFAKDCHGRYLLANEATGKYLGRSSAEIIGRDDTELLSADDASAIMAGDRRVMEQREVMTYEDFVTTADGVPRTFLSTKGPIYDENGDLSGMFGISRDITPLKYTEQQLQERKEEMERFTYMVSHDLKSPLVTIKTFLGYLHHDLEKADLQRAAEDMGHMSGAADKIGQLLDELLEMSRIGRAEKPPTRTSFREVVDEALTMVAGQLARSSVEVKVAEDSFPLTGDRDRLVAIWQNLVDNAVKYMGEQQDPLVEIGFDGSGPGTSFFVQDNGMGIAGQDLEKIFGVCIKLDSASEGTGLGLAMTRKIVEIYGGTIVAQSAGVGMGSTFRFTLPRAVAMIEEKG